MCHTAACWRYDFVNFGYGIWLSETVDISDFNSGVTSPISENRIDWSNGSEIPTVSCLPAETWEVFLKWVCTFLVWHQEPLSSCFQKQIQYISVILCLLCCRLRTKKPIRLNDLVLKPKNTIKFNYFFQKRFQ